ncbi:MAG: matrixin family metalloprotease [Bryobacterales bacterium]|nr:matrixin family metalloprotease [Bryobacterales bacterium]
MGRRIVELTAIIIAGSSLASAYYNWTYFAGHSAPFNPVHASFDLNALPNGTVSYFISDQPPSPLMPGDSFQAVVSQIRAAADVWNQVPTSALRVAFGGISTIGATQQATPGIDIVFDDNLPPGLLAQTRPTVPSDLSFVANGAAFVPILRSRVQFRRDLTANNQFSGGDAFFLTAVHEIGHALGLQHTLTSAVMSTAVTRATTKAAPLAADDIAGISNLYPAGGFAASTGSISGTVALNGNGVNLASVVALSTSGVAISGMTNPDGTYQIQGIPPGQYYVYAHPLPPPLNGESTPANIVAPVDSQQNPFPANTGFDTEFFPGTKDWTQATLVTVSAAANVPGVNFNMQARSTVAIPYVLSYGYQGTVPVPSPPILGGTAATIVYYAPSTTSSNALLQGVTVSVVGGPSHLRTGTLQYYPASNGYSYFVLDSAPVTSPTPVALAVSLFNDLYVLPSALTLVPNAPVSIISAAPTGATTAQGDPVVNVVGTNLAAVSGVTFDGAAGTILGTNSDGSLSVAAPPANSAYVATVEGLTSDGQTSQQGLGSNSNATFTYSAPANPSISVTPANLLPGTDAMIEIDATGMNFQGANVSVGFGSSDITVKQMWVAGPGRLLMNISVSGQAQAGSVQVTVACGLELVDLKTVMQVLAANPRQISLHAPVLNQATGLPGIPAGGGAVVSTSGLPQAIGSGWTLTVAGERSTPVLSGGQLYFQVPNGIAVGPAAVQLTSPNGDQIPTVVMQIDPPPPVVIAAVNSVGVPIDTTHPVKQGDQVILTVAGLDDSSGNPPAISSVQINVGGMLHSPSAILASSIAGAVQIPFVLNSNVPYGPQQALTVGVGTRISSQNFTIAILPR